MNANELADYLDNNVEAMIMSEQTHIDQAAIMLRQQQAEIEALKQVIDANNLNQNIGQFVKPANEPVAWMHQNPEYPISKHWSQEYNIPLYTYSAKTLTDEEIDELVHEYNCIDDFPHEFVRACIRKAQEK